MFFLWGIIFFNYKKYSSIITYITFGVYFSLFLYLLYWSNLADKTKSFLFNYIFIITAVLCTVYAIISCKNNNISPVTGNVYVTKFGKQIFWSLNLVFLLLYFFENYLGSHSFFPGLVGIDIHTYSAPIISYFTNAQYLLLVFNYYYFKATKKKISILFIFIDTIVPVITRLARMSIVIALFQFGSLVIFLFMSQRKNNITLKEKKSLNRKKKNIIRFGIFGFIVLSVFTQYRMNLHNADFSYSDGIGFIGPKWLNWLSAFYGYFPMSFNNLKINILYRTVKHNYVGLYSFFSLYFGIFQIDNIFGINTTGQLVGRLITNGLATVPTAFWDFYYDFGLLFFIPIIVGMIITYYFEKKASKERLYLTYRTLYFWYAPYWFFISFQNTLFLAPAIINAFLIYFIIKYSFRIKAN